MPSRSHSDPALEPRLLKALAHPLRYRVLWRLTETVASPKELADELGEPLPKVAYHVNVLHDAGLIELVRETPRRGAVEHHYRAIARPVLRDADLARVPPAVREQLSGAVLAEVFRDLRAAIESGTLQARTDWHVSHMSMRLDEKGWAELGGMLAKVVERAIELNAQADGAPIAARLSLMLYEGAPTPGTEAS